MDTSESYQHAKERPSFENIYLRFAQSISERSTCERLHVGTVITTTDYRQVLALGYNGNAAKMPNHCTDKTAVGNCGCLHAEENAIINCNAPRYLEKVVFTTHSPCMMCTKRFINMGGITTLYYVETYRDDLPLKVLREWGIKVIKCSAW